MTIRSLIVGAGGGTMTATGIARALLARGKTDAQVRAAIGGAASLTAGLSSVLSVPVPAPTPAPSPTPTPTPTASPTAAGNRSATMTLRQALPDGQYPATVGKGWPCTGLDLDADGTMWAGHGTAGSVATAGVVHVNAALDTIIAQFTVGAMGLPNGSVQGVTVDDSDGTLFFVLVDTVNTKRYIVHCTKAGALIASTEYTASSINGLAYDNHRDCLITLYNTGTIRWIEKTAPHAFVAGTPNFVAAGGANDQLFYDASRRELLVSGGANEVAGTIDVYGVGASAQTLIATITLTDCLAIEGVVRRGDDCVVLSDQWTHPASGNAFNINQANFYANGFAVVASPPTYAFAATRYAVEGTTASFTLNATRNNTTGDLSGTWTVAPGSTNPADADDFGGTFPSGTWTIPDGATSTTIDVTSSQDASQEGDQTYVLTASVAGVAKATATGTIGDDDAPAGTYSAEATALFARMTTEPVNARKTAIDNLIVALKTAGVWASIDALFVPAAHDAQAAALDWTHDRALTVNGATAWTADRGYTTSGANTSYLNLGFGPNQATSYTRDSATLLYWSNRDAATGSSGSATFGTLDTGNLISLNPRAPTSDLLAGRANSGSGTAGAAQATGRGLSGWSRTGATAVQAYKNGQPSGAASTAASAVLTNVTAFTVGRRGSDAEAAQAAAMIVGAGFNASQNAAVWNAISAYMAAVGNG